MKHTKWIQRGLVSTLMILILVLSFCTKKENPIDKKDDKDDLLTTTLSKLAFEKTEIEVIRENDITVEIITTPKNFNIEGKITLDFEASKTIFTAILVEKDTKIKITGKAVGEGVLKISFDENTEIQASLKVKILPTVPIITSGDFPENGLIPNTFENASNSPSFTLKNIDPSYKYLSILMVDHYGQPGNWSFDIKPRWLHWEQKNIDISGLGESITVESQNLTFNSNQNANLSYKAMTPPKGSGKHKYDFYFFLHQEPKTFTHTLSNVDLSNNGPKYLADFRAYFSTDKKDVELNVWGTITK